MEENRVEAPTITEQLKERLRDVMAVELVNDLLKTKGYAAFEGRLYEEPDEALYERIALRFEELGYTAMLSEKEDGTYQVLALKGVPRPKPRRATVNVLLFIATFFTTTLVGASVDAGPGLLDVLLSGLPFSIALMSILLAHELAHYFVARRYGSPVTLPFFIPVPLPPLGTMGAVIRQEAPMRSRKALFDIGVAGPLAGLVVAIPLLIGGLMFTQVGRPSDFIEVHEGVVQEGNSLVYLAAKYLVFGRVLPDESGQDVWLSQPASPGGPVAFAAWAGLLVTMFNLLPVGQLDGGHVAYALLGRRAWRLAYVMIGLIGVLVVYLLIIDSPAAFTWLLWVVLMLVVRPRHPPPLNDVTPLDWKRKWLGILVGVIFVLIYVPLPLVPVQ